MTNDQFHRFFFLRMVQWLDNNCEPTEFRGRILPFRKDTGLCGNLMWLMYQFRLPVDRQGQIMERMLQNFQAANLSRNFPFNPPFNSISMRNTCSTFTKECLEGKAYENPARVNWIRLWGKR